MPITKSGIKRKRKENIIDIRPISRKYYPVDYRDINKPVWYDAAFTNMEYALACIEHQMGKELSKYFKIHRGRYIKDNHILRATTPFRFKKRVKKYIYTEENIASPNLALGLRNRIRRKLKKKKLGKKNKYKRT